MGPPARASFARDGVFQAQVSELPKLGTEPCAAVPLTSCTYCGRRNPESKCPGCGAPICGDLLAGALLRSACQRNHTDGFCPAPPSRSTDLQLSRCRLRIFRLPVEGGMTEFTVLITELPQGQRSDRLANPGRPAMECLADLLPEVNRTYLLKIPDGQITWFYHRRGVLSAQRPRRHDDVYRISSFGPIGGCQVPVLIEATLEELDLACGGFIEL